MQPASHCAALGSGILRVVALLLLVLSLSGCFTTFAEGGMPQASFDVDADIKKLATTFDTAKDIDAFYAAPSETTRNRFVTGRLALVDLRYLQFIRGLTADKQQLDAAGDLANLTLNLAGTLVGSARAKTNLAAAAAGIGGTKTSVEKNFYYERSVDALVSTMNAKRKEVLVRILGSISGSLEAYAFPLAVADVHDYFQAGTLNGALNFISSQAGEQEKSADRKLELVRDKALLPPAINVVKGKLTDSLAAGDLSLDRANKALLALGQAPDKLPVELADSKSLLQTLIRKAGEPHQVLAVKKAFEDAGIYKP